MSTKKVSYFIIAAIAIGTLAIITAGLLHPAQSSQQIASPSTVGSRVGNMAPNFTLTTLSGKKVSLSDYRGRTVMLNFWRTDCVSCLGEMPDLQKVYASQQATHSDFVILAVELSGDAPGSQRIAQQKSLTFPVVLDANSTVGDLYHVSNTPTSFLLDRQGIIRWATIGPLSEESLQNALKQFN